MIQDTGFSHEWIEATLAVLGVGLGVIQAFTLFILSDIRERLVRLEDLAIEGRPK